MSALWRAEIRQLMQLLENDAAERAAEQAAADAVRKKRRRIAGNGVTQRATRRKSRAVLIKWLQHQTEPATANQAALGTGLAHKTADKRLRELAKENSIVAYPTPSGRARYAMESST